MKKVKHVFNVLNWDFNTDTLEVYDVLPYFRDKYKGARKKNKPVTRDDWKEFIKQWGMYQFWSRCEYEVIITGWPQQKNNEKVDIWKQIEINLDVITDLLYSEYVK